MEIAECLAIASQYLWVRQSRAADCFMNSGEAPAYFVL